MITMKPGMLPLVIVPVVIAVLVLALWIVRETDPFKLRSLIFPAPDYATVPSVKGGSLIETATFQSPGSRVSRGFFARNGDKLVVLFHGNGSTIGDLVFLGMRFFDEGYSVLIPEYPGYGVSAQYDPGESAMYEDAAALIRYAASEYGFDGERTFVLGHSLGTGVAVEMAKRKLASRMILLAPFTSVPSVASRMIPVIPWLVIRDVFDNKSKAGGIGLPVIVIHGTKDTVIPYAEGAELARSFRNAELITMEGKDHGLPVDIVNDGQVWKKIIGFLGD